jgi:hypothetical protein
VEQVRRAILEHDENMAEYNERADACIWRFHVDNPDNMDVYDHMLWDLIALPPHQFTSDELDILKSNIPPVE